MEALNETVLVVVLEQSDRNGKERFQLMQFGGKMSDKLVSFPKAE